MHEQRFVMKAADLVTPAGGEGSQLVDALLLPVDGGRAKVFGLLSVSHNDPGVREAFNRVLHSHLDLARQTMAGEANIPRRFENMLADLNAALAETAAAVARMPITDFESIVGVVTDTQLFASGIGNHYALFLHKTAERRFVIYELHAQFRTDAEATWEKPFLTILDGEIHPGDLFYVATRTPSTVIAMSDLQDILLTLPPAGALQRIRQFLPHDAAYGALCFTAAEEERTGPPKKSNPITSITQLGDIKHETADLLGEQGSDVTGFIRRGVALVSAKLSAPGSRGYKHVLKSLARLLVHVCGIVIIGVMTLLRLLLRGVVTLVRHIFDASRTARTTAPHRTMQRRLAGGIHRIASLPPSQKYLAGGIAGVVVLIIVSVAYLGHASEQRLAEEAFQTAITRIEEKTSAAEASLIYNDTETASGLLREAAALLETLSADGSMHEERLATLTAALETLQTKIRKITQVEPTTIAALGAEEAGLATVAGVDGTLYAFAMDAELFRVNELANEIAKVGSSNGTLSGIVAATAENTNILFIDGAKRLGRANLTDNTLRPITSGVDGMASAEDLVVYNSALYVLSAASQQIVKMRPQGDGYEAGTPWISARASDLIGARAIAVDGSVYILTATDVFQYKSGREVTWDHDTLEPSLQDAVDLWTSVDSSYLYILDRGEGRVIVYNKEDGSVVTQYAAPMLIGSMGFLVRESDKQILVALPGKVVAFTATHLVQ